MRKWLKTLRKRKRLTQSYVAEMLNVSRSYYARVESGKRQVKMPIETVKKLSEIFGVSIEYILEQECK